MQPAEPPSVPLSRRVPRSKASVISVPPSTGVRDTLPYDESLERPGSSGLRGVDLPPKRSEDEGVSRIGVDLEPSLAQAVVPSRTNGLPGEISPCRPHCLGLHAVQVLHALAREHYIVGTRFVGAGEVSASVVSTVPGPRVERDRWRVVLVRRITVEGFELPRRAHQIGRIRSPLRFSLIDQGRSTFGIMDLQPVAAQAVGGGVLHGLHIASLLPSPLSPTADRGAHESFVST